MSNLTEARSDIELEDVKFRASISEAVGNKMGASINFINRKQYDKHSWNLNGPYSLGVGSTGTDGVYTFLFDAEIVGFSYFNGTTGTSGTTTIDITYLDVAQVDQGSIFSTLPSVTTTAANNTFTTYDVLNSTTLSNPTGHTLAVMSTTSFNAGDTLRLDLNAAMIAANNFQMTIYFRPR